MIDKLALLKSRTDAATASAEDERLVQLFQNRAGLKKAYDDLQDELHLLVDRLKQQEGATLRLQEQFDALAELLADPAAGYGALVFFQLRALWKVCHQKLATFAGELIRQHERRERVAWEEEWTAGQQSRLQEAGTRLSATLNGAAESREELADMQRAVDSRAAFWHYFERRRLQRSMEPFRARAVAADAEVAAVQNERRAIADEVLPEFPGISLRARRNTNLAIIAYAEVLCELVDGYSVTARAKEAVARRVQDMEFGSQQQCELDMQRIQKARTAVEAQHPLKAGVKERLEHLRSACQYRNSADTVPTADSLESGRARPQGAPARPWNALAEDYWDLYTLLLR